MTTPQLSIATTRIPAAGPPEPAAALAYSGSADRDPVVGSITPDHPSPTHNHDHRDPHDVRAAQGGDPDAMGRLYTRHARMVRAVLLAYLTPNDADDIVQEVFIRAIRKIGQVHNESGIGAWLAVTARNEARDWKRRIARRWKLLLRFQTQRDADLRTPRRCELDGDDVLAAIRRIPEEYREVLVMRLVERMTGPQIAAWSGRSHRAVRVSLHRGMHRLRQELGLEVRPGLEARS